VQPAQVPGVYPEVAGLKENHPDTDDVAIVSSYSDSDITVQYSTVQYDITYILTASIRVA
jgi:hypothetical protein